MEEIKSDKLEAIKYLVDNSEYHDEWSGAGMWEAVVEVMTFDGVITQEYLKELLKKAEHF